MRRSLARGMIALILFITLAIVQTNGVRMGPDAVVSSMPSLIDASNIESAFAALDRKTAAAAPAAGPVLQGRFGKQDAQSSVVVEREGKAEPLEGSIGEVSDLPRIHPVGPERPTPRIHPVGPERPTPRIHPVGPEKQPRIHPVGPEKQPRIHPVGPEKQPRIHPVGPEKQPRIHPVGPERPSPPIHPVGPERPTPPIHPVGPERPTPPIHPVGPERPPHIRPVGPERPTPPIHPVGPERPTPPIHPVGPERPTPPIHPVGPEVPASEEGEVELVEPANPSETQQMSEMQAPFTLGDLMSRMMARLRAFAEAPDLTEPPHFGPFGGEGHVETKQLPGGGVLITRTWSNVNGGAEPAPMPMLEDDMMSSPSESPRSPFEFPRFPPSPFRFLMSADDEQDDQVFPQLRQQEHIKLHFRGGEDDDDMPSDSDSSDSDEQTIPEPDEPVEAPERPHHHRHRHGGLRGFFHRLRHMFGRHNPWRRHHRHHGRHHAEEEDDEPQQASASVPMPDKQPGWPMRPEHGPAGEMEKNVPTDEDTEGVPPPPPRPHRRHGSWARRHRRELIAAGVVLFVLTLLGVAAFVHYRRSRKVRESGVQLSPPPPMPIVAAYAPLAAGDHSLPVVDAVRVDPPREPIPAM